MVTKQRILNAFNDLIERNGFDNVTVFDIVRHAGVSRATFYRHFKDKYDVMNYNYSSLVNRHITESGISSMCYLFELLLEEGTKYRKPLVPLFDTEGVNSLYRFIYAYSFETGRNLYEYHDLHVQDEKYASLSEKETFQLKLFAGGAAAVYEEWIKGKFDLNAKEAACSMSDLLPEFLKTDEFNNMLKDMKTGGS